ncbi:MAG: N-acetyl-gamma-glutamyl-phosphate reductase [Ekhidna sp.]|nr:N-acetyl-gamma-glutamyl-phosphate reductase [Ekhidna sp.]
MIKVGIIGAAGYTAGELIRILIHHSQAEIIFLQSESHAGKNVAEVHKDLIGETDLLFSKEISKDEVGVFFLCKGHSESKIIVEQNPFVLKKKVIDLSQDFRLKTNHDFVYGLPEINRNKLRGANHIANPGCFATSIQLSLLPAIKLNSIAGSVSISGITGATGAGQKLSPTSHFSWRSNNASVYKALTHQHLLEVNETFKSINTDFDSKLLFIPYRGAFTRGIITTAHFETSLSENQLLDTYKHFYAEAPFTHIVEENPDLKQVVGTNKCLVYPKVINGTAIVISVIDNLLKGASGQAVQNMNLQFGIPEKTGLNLKSIVF